MKCVGGLLEVCFQTWCFLIDRDEPFSSLPFGHLFLLRTRFKCKSAGNINGSSHSYFRVQTGCSYVQ